MAELLANPHSCAACKAPGCKMKCPCKQVNYCGKDCQKADWPLHKLRCAALMDRKVKDKKRELGKDNIEVGHARLDAGKVHYKEGRYHDAERCLLEARRIYTEHYGNEAAKRFGGEEHKAAFNAFNPEIADVCICLGELYDASGQYDKSIEALQEALDIRRRNDETGKSIEVGEALSLMARTLSSMHRHKEALAMQEKAQVIYEETFGAEHESTADVLSDKAHTYVGLQQPDKALETYRRVHRIWAKVHGAESEEAATTILNIGCAYGNLGMIAEEKAQYQEALEICRRLHGEKHPSVATCLFNLATTLKAQGKYDEAHALYRKVLKIRRKCYGEAHDMYADTLVNVANLYGEEEEFEEALKLQLQASEIYARTLGEDSFKSATVRAGISCTQHMLGNSKIAQHEAERAVRMFQELGEVQNAWYANAVNILGYYGKQ